MRAHYIKKNNLINYSKKFFAGGKEKKIDPKLKDFDLLVVGGLNGANLVKWFQHKHFHGTIGAINHSSKFYYEHLYEMLWTSNMKPYKYTAMPFTSNYDTFKARAIKDTVVKINADKNEVVTEKGDVYKYKCLVLNTGLNQKGTTDPIYKDYIQDEFAKTRIFVQETNNLFQVNRNARIAFMHKDGDFLLYLPKGASRREAQDHWYLMLDSYFSRGFLTESRPRSMRLRVITPNNYLFKFPFANEVIQEEITNRSSIDVHFGMELVKFDLKQTILGYERNAVFKDLKTGQEVVMPFGTFVGTPEPKTRKLYENSDLVNEEGLVTVNPYSLQHTKYQNIFAFGDCTNVATTRNLYATLNQQVVVRNNVWDYLHGSEMKAVYEGYTSYPVFHAFDRFWIFKHTYNYEPTATNFYVPRFYGWLAYKLKSPLERNYLGKIYQQKMNFGYPYLSKDRYFRPLNENKYLQRMKLSEKDVFPHHYEKPVLSCDHDHGHGSEHKAVAHH